MTYSLSYKTSNKDVFVWLIDQLTKLFSLIQSVAISVKKEDFIANKIFGLFGGSSKASQDKDLSSSKESTQKTYTESSGGGSNNPWQNPDEDEEEEILRYRDAMLENQINPVARLRIVVISSFAVAVLAVIIAFQAIIYVYQPFSKIKTPTPLSSAIMVNSDGFTVYANNVDSDLSIQHVSYEDISYDAIEAVKAYLSITQSEYNSGSSSGTGTCSTYDYNFSNQLLCNTSFLFRLAESNIFTGSNAPSWFKTIVVAALYFRYSEVEALEIYLNTLRYNANVYGIKQASEVFFNKEPKNINIVEAIELINTSRNFQDMPYNVYKASSKEKISLYLTEKGKVLEDSLISLRRYLEEDKYYVGSKNLFSHYQSSVNYSSVFDVLNSSGGNINDVRIYTNVYQALQNSIYSIVNESLIGSSEESSSMPNTASVVVLSGKSDVITSFTMQKQGDGDVKFYNGYPRSKPGYIIKPILYSIVEGYAYEIPQVLKDTLVTDMRNLIAVENAQITIDEQIASSKSARTSESYRKALRKIATEIESHRLEKDFLAMETKLPFVLPESIFEGYFTIEFDDVVKMYSILLNGGYYNTYQYYNAMFVTNKLNNIPTLPPRQVLTESVANDIKEKMMLYKPVGQEQEMLYYTAGQNMAIGIYKDMVIGVWYGHVKNDINNDATRQNYAQSLDTMFSIVNTIISSKPYAKINAEDVYSNSVLTPAEESQVDEEGLSEEGEEMQEDDVLLEEDGEGNAEQATEEVTSEENQ